MRHSQGSVGAPHGLKDCRASDAKSTNVRTADVDRRLVCEHVRKPLYGPRPLIFDRTTSTVEANSLRHPQGDPATATDFGRKLPANSPHGGRMCDVTRALSSTSIPDLNDKVLFPFRYQYLVSWELSTQVLPPSYELHLSVHNNMPYLFMQTILFR